MKKFILDSFPSIESLSKPIPPPLNTLEGMEYLLKEYKGWQFDKAILDYNKAEEGAFYAP